MESAAARPSRDEVQILLWNDEPAQQILTRTFPVQALSHEPSSRTCDAGKLQVQHRPSSGTQGRRQVLDISRQVAGAAGEFSDRGKLERERTGFDRRALCRTSGSPLKNAHSINCARQVPRSRGHVDRICDGNQTYARVNPRARRTKSPYGLSPPRMCRRRTADACRTPSGRQISP